MSTSQLQELIQSYSNPELLEQFVFEKEQYTDDALSLIQKEIDKRGISADEILEFTKKGLVDSDAESGNVQVRHFKKDEFVKLNGMFLIKDNALLRAMFTEENIAFYFDTTVEKKEGEEPASRGDLGIYVHKDFIDKAVALIAAHFDFVNDVYTMKYTDVRQRLKSFSFQEIQHADLSKAQIDDVSFSADEKNVFLTYGKRLLNEIDKIETEQERIVFFYDNIEELIERLNNPKESLVVTDLLAALEILQIYCDEPDFPTLAHGLAESLLSFFQDALI